MTENTNTFDPSSGFQLTAISWIFMVDLDG